MPPRFRLNAHVVYYSATVLAVSGFAFSYSYAFGKSEEEKIAELVSSSNLSSFLVISILIAIASVIECRSINTLID